MKTRTAAFNTPLFCFGGQLILPINLALGVCSICYYVGRALAGAPMPVPTDVPDPT